MVWDLLGSEFKMFLEENGVKQITRQVHYHPAINGLAERAIQIMKRGLRKVTARSINSRLAKVLCSYRVTPQSTTGISPAELLLGRRSRTQLDLLKPHTAERVEAKQSQQKVTHMMSEVSHAYFTWGMRCM